MMPILLRLAFLPWQVLFQPTGYSTSEDLEEEPIEEEPLKEPKEEGALRPSFHFCVILEWFKMCNVPLIQSSVATVLFYSGSDFSFISTEFVPYLNVKLSILKPDYVLEVANGKKIETDKIIRGCKLELGDSLFTIDMIPFGHGSFDVIVVMDWLSRHKAEIVFMRRWVGYHWQMIRYS
ncbi:putative reverse transcriptase domain-containing protein [Tanacetum coccineum]